MTLRYIAPKNIQCVRFSLKGGELDLRVIKSRKTPIILLKGKKFYCTIDKM
jgi:hypothetical protein